uniref:Uncharacterized protein n=1 Tax=Ralstonia syzygii R24 TaxID=907261 RepID=G3AAC6_9RALS|nr:hypothetical protein RALSY_mp10122 [Ralstonia syzygii R24]
MGSAIQTAQSVYQVVPHPSGRWMRQQCSTLTSLFFNPLSFVGLLACVLFVATTRFFRNVQSTA